MFSDIEKDIQELAEHKFPADELWIKGTDFWAFKKGYNIVYETTGHWTENGIVFNTVDIWTYEPEIKIDFLVEQKTEQGYKCFAILL